MVTIATSLDYCETYVHFIICIHYIYQRWNTGKDRFSICWDIGQFWPCRSTIFIFSPTLKTTEPIFTIFSHDVVELLMRVSDRRYPIPFRKDRAISVGGVGNFCHKIGCHGNVLWGIGKTGPDRENPRKFLPFGEKNRENRSSRYWDSFAHI